MGIRGVNGTIEATNADKDSDQQAETARFEWMIGYTAAWPPGTVPVGGHMGNIGYMRKA